MKTTQVRIHDVLSMFRRRWKLFACSLGVVTAISIIGAYTLTRKYESSTTIMVRPDRTLSPMTGYDMAMAFEEQLRNYAEIIYSRSVLSALGDSLGYHVAGSPEVVVQSIIRDLGGSISTTRLGSDSFRITFVDTDPARAQRGAEKVAELFIRTKTDVENRQNALVVEFYEGKVREYRAEYDNKIRGLVTSMRRNVADIPKESRTLYNQVDEVEKTIRSVDGQITLLESNLAKLKTLPDRIQYNPDEFRREDGKQPLFELTRGDLPYVQDLRTLVNQYDQMTRSYNGKYPEVEKLEGQIVEMLKRMRTATEVEIDNLRTQLQSADQRRSQVIDGLKDAFVAQKVNQDNEASYDVERKQYEDMKNRLEQARLAQEVASRGANQFIVLDPAYMPTLPTKPNRTMIILGGLGIGFALGLLGIILAELLDTTVRTPRDMEIYQKPIIALLPEGEFEQIE